MFARNPFEKALNSDAAPLDMERGPPRDLMADAFISEVMSRLADGARHGYMPGMWGDQWGSQWGGREPEHNGFPIGPGLHNTSHTYPAISNHPIRMNPFGLGPRGMSFGGDTYGAALGGPMARFGPMDIFEDGFAPGPDAGIGTEFGTGFETDQLALDALPYAGSDGIDSGAGPDPFSLPRPTPLPSVPVVGTDRGLDVLRQAIRPGYAELSTFGYSEPVTDPYAENLTSILRRLVRQA